MDKEKALAIDFKKVISIAIQAALLVGIAIAAPLFGQQLVTGTIVNATLFAAAILLGTQAGISVGLIPSLVALYAGTLPPVLSPMIPFIMVGNTILILTFGFLKNKNYWLAVALASLFKFVFIFGASSIMFDLFIKKQLVGPVALMMGWPQLVTALLGGLLASLVLGFIKPKNEILRD
jgi:hypothetical protein